jgi:hypothetical protein
MGLIGLLIVLAVVGFLVWLLTTYVPMPDPIKQVIIVIVVIVMILYVLQLFVGDIPLPRFR